MSTKTELVKAKIAEAGSQFMSVTFTKKDGSLRTINFNPKTAKGLVKERTIQGEQALQTRKKNNPNLVSVCDNSLLKDGADPKRAWRSINCETVTMINGEAID